MNITAIKTHKITKKDTNLLSILDKHLIEFQEKSVLVIASKIVAITQGRIAKLSEEEKETVIKKEAEYYLPKEENKYGLYITINDNYLNYSSGIDESNADGYSVLWPEKPYEVANTVREYLCSRFKITYAGVIITDMAAIPLQWGLFAGPIAYSGFKPFKDISGTPDIFGREFKYTKEGHLQGMAAAAGAVMGEGAQQTPLGVITDIPFVEFQDRNPTQEELDSFKISFEEDLYGSMIKSAKWQKGGK